MESSNFKINSLKIKKDKDILVDISFEIKSSLAIVGESGSGKSLTLKALLGMLPSNLIAESSFESDFKIDNKNIGYVPQNPFTSLSPLTRIKYHFSSSDAKQKELLSLVDVDIDSLNKFPMQLSGGQLQRIIIALSLERNPLLLLLDEPTTALDTKNKVIVLNILKSLQKQLNFKMLFVTHDINSIKDLCEDILILKKGKICESGKTMEVLANPKTKYTKNIIESNFRNREFRV